MVGHANRRRLRHSLALALDLIDQGFPAFTVTASGPNGKTRLTLHGFIDATIDPDQVRTWFLRHLDGLVAYPTSSATTVVCFKAVQRERTIRTPTPRAAIRDNYPSDWTAAYAAYAAREQVEILRRAKPGDALHRQASSDLHEAGRELAELTDGRRNALYRIGCRVSKYVAHGVVSENEFRAVMTAAAAANGSVAKHGRAWASCVLTSVLAVGRNDPLPPVANHFRMGGLAA